MLSLFLFSSSLSQTTDISSLLNATVSNDCKSAANTAVPSALNACGGNNFYKLVAKTNPLDAFLAANDKSFLPAYCSNSCKSSITSMSTQLGVCSNQIVFNDTDVTVSNWAAQSSAYNTAFCVKDNNEYCFYFIYNGLTKYGFDSSNIETLSTAFNRLLRDKEFTCATCSLKFADAFESVKDSFAYGPIISGSIKPIVAKCTSSAFKASFLLAFVALLLA